MHIRNDFDCEKSFFLKARLINEKAPVIDKFSREVVLSAGDATYIEGELELLAPLLWSPEEPNLYILKTDLVLDGEVVYTKETEVGLRTF